MLRNERAKNAAAFEIDVLEILSGFGESLCGIGPRLRTRTGKNLSDRSVGYTARERLIDQCLHTRYFRFVLLIKSDEFANILTDAATTASLDLIVDPIDHFGWQRDLDVGH